MRIMAQMSMVMNLDKCIGCHTCSVACKQAWTNRTGTEYVWFNNVETPPGQGYPRTYEDQERWQGGWVLNKRGRLTLKAGGRLRNLLTIFSSPKMPSITDYYEPWTYDYENLTNAPLQEHTPVARPKSLISGKDMNVTWSANWDDDLGGGPELLRHDVVPLGGDLQACGGRHRPGRPGRVPRVAQVHHQLPVQEGLLQPQDRQGREVRDLPHSSTLRAQHGDLLALRERQVPTREPAELERRHAATLAEPPAADGLRRTDRDPGVLAGQPLRDEYPELALDLPSKRRRPR